MYLSFDEQNTRWNELWTLIAAVRSRPLPFESTLLTEVSEEADEIHFLVQELDCQLRIPQQK